MLKLVFRNSLSLGFLCLIFLVGCRKEINHEAGTTVSTEKPGWQRISISPILDVYAIESMGNLLFIGGSFSASGLPGIAAYNPQNDAYYQVSTGNLISGSVYDMEVHEGFLYVGGNFYVSSSPFDLVSLFKVNDFAGIYDVDFVDYSAQTVFDVTSYGDTLIVTGEFAFNSTTAPNIYTENVEFVVNDYPTGAADISIPIHGSCKANGEVYIVGENGYFAYFTGSGWGVIEYPEKSNQDMIYDVATIGNTIYLVGKFSGNTFIRTFNWSNGQWGQVSSLGAAKNILHGAGFKWIDGELYVFGNDMYDLSGNYTNIFKSTNGVNWSPVGTITEYVRNVAQHDGKMYAASTKGIYRLNE